MKKAFYEYRRLTRDVPPLTSAMLILSVVGMNLLANKSIDTGLSWLAMDGGILFSWLVFLTMDIITHSCGPKAATAMSMTALFVNLMMAVIFFTASVLPGSWGESYVEGSEAVINNALDRTFGGTWYIILGSSVAFAVSAALNNFLNYAIGKAFRNKEGFGIFALRSYISTFIAQFADNLIFGLLVSRLFFGWGAAQLISCAFLGAILELLTEILFSPVGYRISRMILRDKRGTAAEAKI